MLSFILGIQRKNELSEAINELRRQVNDIHVNGRPDIFKPGFCKELQDHAEWYLSSDNNDIFVTQFKRPV